MSSCDLLPPCLQPEDRTAITDLLYEYCHAVDTKDWELVSAIRLYFAVSLTYVFEMVASI